MDLTKQSKIELADIITKIKRGIPTYFLDEKRIELVHNILKKQNINHNIFYPYEGATYGVIYSNNLNVSLIKIISEEKLTHSSIMGSLYSLNLKKEMFGDIIIDKYCYVLVISHMKDYVINNIYKIGNTKVILEECDIKEVEQYIPIYELYTTTVNSKRLDAVISKIIGISRNMVLEKIKNKEIILNYEIATKSSYLLKEGDIFSIRRYGKYKYLGSTCKSKKDRFVIEYKKYAN